MVGTFVLYIQGGKDYISPIDLILGVRAGVCTFMLIKSIILFP